jgi:hypothetical protein
MQLNRILNKIKVQNERLSLNLKDKIILTEAATGAYIVTPLIAAMAGAKVYAYAKDSKYGSASEIIDMYRTLLKKSKMDLDISCIDELSAGVISECDVITNSGHLRPLDSSVLQFAGENCVIPLMYETWELRESDIDLNFCRERRIRVGGTNERHPDIDVFSYLGDMAVKLILDSGVCLHENYFVLICNNEFGPYIAKVVSRLCKGLGVSDIAERKTLYSTDIDWLGDFPDFKASENYKKAEAIIFTAYPFHKVWIGDKQSELPAEKLLNEFENPFILRYAGDIDVRILDILEIPYYPQEVAPGHMGILPSHIGFDPVIRLQSGGLKAGELMLNGKTRYNDIELVELL